MVLTAGVFGRHAGVRCVPAGSGWVRVGFGRETESGRVRGSTLRCRRARGLVLPEARALQINADEALGLPVPFPRASTVSVLRCCPPWCVGSGGLWTGCHDRGSNEKRRWLAPPSSCTVELCSLAPDQFQTVYRSLQERRCRAPTSPQNNGWRSDGYPGSGLDVGRLSALFIRSQGP